MITLLGRPPNYPDFRKAIHSYNSEGWFRQHLIAPAWMLPANVRLSLSSVTHLYNTIFLLSIEDAKKFTRSITYPVAFLFTIPVSLFYPQAMCRLWGFSPLTPPRGKIYYAED